MADLTAAGAWPAGSVVRPVAVAHGVAQPDPDSYSSAELVGWLMGAAFSPGDVAAVELLAHHGKWLDRADWRERCVTIIENPAGKRIAYLEFEAWRVALEERRAYTAAEDVDRPGLPVGLDHSPTGRVVAELAAWLAVSAHGLGRLDLSNTRHLLGAIATACGHTMRDVIGGPWPLEPVAWPSPRPPVQVGGRGFSPGNEVDD